MYSGAKPKDDKAQHSNLATVVVAGLVGILIGMGIGKFVLDSKMPIYDVPRSYYATESVYHKS